MWIPCFKVLIYVFAVTLRPALLVFFLLRAARQLTSGTDFGQSFFSSVPNAPLGP